MPWEHPWLYPVQTILLVQPQWMMLLWPIWTLFISRGWNGGLKWGVRLCTMPTLLWTLGAFDLHNAPKDGAEQILIANVNAYAGEQDMLQGYLSLLGVSKLILVEKRAEEITGLRRVADDFDTVVKKPSHHTAVFCKEYCQAWISPQVGSTTMSMSLALLSLPNQICLIAVHIPPPTPIDATGMRPYVEYVTSVIEKGRLLRDWEVCSKGDAAIVAGDFNAVAGGWAPTQLLNRGLIDAQRNSGLWGATWPSESKDFVQWPVFRIDHVLHHPNIGVSTQQIRIPHSDHEGLLLSISSRE